VDEEADTVVQIRSFAFHGTWKRSRGCMLCGEKNVLQFKLEMDESAIHYFFDPAAASLVTIPKESSINWR